jgi:hypothetical protein
MPVYFVCLFIGMLHATGTIGPLSNNSSTYFKCDADPFKDLPSFDPAAYISRVTFATILAILILPTIFLNITILIAIIKNRTLWRSSHILIGFLAVTDALVGAFSMPLLLSTVLIEIIYERSSYYKQVYCILSQAALNAGDLGIGWSFITIALITFERYVAIFAPFWYRKYVRTSVVVKTTLVIWVIWAAAVVILILNITLEFAVGVVILILVVTVYVLAVPAYIRILYLLKKIESSPIPETNSRPTIDRKGSITCAIMLLCLILCYTPLIVVSLVLVTKGVSKTVLTYILPWTRLVVLANSFFNPIIYICRIALIRRSAKNIFKRFYKKASSQPGTAAPSVPAVELGANNGAAVISQDSKL